MLKVFKDKANCTSNGQMIIRILGIVVLYSSGTYPKPFLKCVIDDGSLFQKVRDIGISKTLLTAIMRLYKSILGCLRTTHELSSFIKSTIEIKQGCPLSPTLFGISTLMSWSPSCMSTSKIVRGAPSTKC
jgi:hypothetical protein